MGKKFKSWVLVEIALKKKGIIGVSASNRLDYPTHQRTGLAMGWQQNRSWKRISFHAVDDDKIVHLHAQTFVNPCWREYEHIHVDKDKTKRNLPCVNALVLEAHQQLLLAFSRVSTYTRANVTSRECCSELSSCNGSLSQKMWMFMHLRQIQFILSLQMWQLFFLNLCGQKIHQDHQVGSDIAAKGNHNIKKTNGLNLC